MNTITRIVDELHAELKGVDDGALADYIPELARVDPNLFGIALTTPDGYSHLVGDHDVPFTIQSVSKAFVYGLVIDELGPEEADARVDLEPSGDAFNEISLDPITSKPMNAMINAGAIAVTGLCPGDGIDDRFGWLRRGLSAFANRDLGFDESVYRSESDTGHRNRAIAYLLRNGGVLGNKVDEDLDLYFRQCSLLVTAADLAVMGATLAHGGINPVSNERVISEDSVERVLSVMCSSGMYNASGTWIAQVGLPAKSGVGGGMVAVLPGELGLAAFSPRLDEQGNSVRGLRTCQALSRRFNLHLFNSPPLANHFIRRSYKLSDSGSTRSWASIDQDYLEQAGSTVSIIELQGDIVFATIERLARAVTEQSLVQMTILDCARIGLVDPSACRLLGQMTADLAGRGMQVIVVDPNGRFHDTRVELGEHCQVVEELDIALEGAELALLGAADLGHARGAFDPIECDLFAGFSEHDFAIIEPFLEPAEHDTGTTLCRIGDPSDEIFVLTSGSIDVRSGPIRGGVRQVRLAALSAGSCAGELGIIDGSPRSADLVAAEPITCLVLDKAGFEKIASEHPAQHALLLKNIMTINLSRLRRSGSTFAHRRD
jgi:glutaminase